ncbi:MAG: glycosyltransferase family 4 protein [Kangiella sp.]|nr:glycosyltransferase family 4 protein [Kangiella sp.]
MNILIVVEAVPPYCGGGEQVAWMHAKTLSKTDNVSVLTFGNEDKVVIQDGIKIYFLKTHKRQLAYYLTKGQKNIAAYMSEIDPDIIHCHMPNVLSLCIRKGHKYMVSTIHDGVPETKARELQNLTWRQYIKFKLTRIINIWKSDYITSVSSHNCALMQSLYKYKKDRIKFIPNAIYDKYFLPLRANTGNGYVLNFGRQIDLKMGSLIDAARLLPEVKFKFIGTGPMVKDYGLQNIEFLGFMSDFTEIIDGASICVFPSLSENFPLSGLEAMARGKPVISTINGFSEYIVHRENGYLIKDNRPSTIVEAINELMNDNDLFQRLSVNARMTAEKYTQSEIISQYKNLYSTF